MKDRGVWCASAPGVANIRDIVKDREAWCAAIHGVTKNQSLSCVWLFVIPWTAANQASLSFTISKCLLKRMSMELVMPSNHLILCCFLLYMPEIFPNITVFSNKSAVHIRWPKYWSFSISPSNEVSWMISFRIGWFGLLAVQGTLKSILQHHSSKASILWHSAFSYGPTDIHTWLLETIALTRWTFVGKVISLLFNMLSRLVIAFLPRNKHLLISWLQSPSTVILEPKKSCHYFHFFPSICHKVIGADAMIFIFFECWIFFN